MDVFKARGSISRYLGSYATDPTSSDGDWWVNSTDTAVRIDLSGTVYEFTGGRGSACF